MLIKPADDRQPQIAALEALLGRSDVQAATRRRIEQEIRLVRAGAAGERDAAYEIEFVYGANPNRMTIHDLRIELDGRVAQFDHLILNRYLDIWVCESKHFSDGVAINEHGEWVALYGTRAIGIPSPVEQNRRHLAVLGDVFAQGLVRLPKRLGMTIHPRIDALVLISNGARISRPEGRAARHVDGLDTVIKVDQLRATVEKALDRKSPVALRSLVGRGTLETVARDLVALHRPAHVDWAARFGLPPTPPPTAMEVPVRRPTAPGDPAWQPAPQRGPDASERGPGRPVCARCGRSVSGSVVAYCELHAAWFGGATYCVSCQKQVGRSGRGDA